MRFVSAATFSLFKLGYRLTQSDGRLASRRFDDTPPDAKLELDGTGRLVNEPKILEVIEDKDRRLTFAYYDSSLSHTFWRAQEFSLFKRASAAFEYPTLDFGCGDGSFSASILDRIDFGIDIDKSALAVARGYNIYGSLLTFDQMMREIPDGSVGTVFSCSALEHTSDLDACLKEIARVLRPGGKAYISVPGPGLTEQMTALIDRPFADAMNSYMYHRNLLPENDWRRRLENLSLRVTGFTSFQPIEFTRRYFCFSLFGNRGLGHIPGLATVRKLLWRILRRTMFRDVTASIDNPRAGDANFFIIATKT
jgi:SAM-dependent methyltransferase